MRFCIALLAFACLAWGCSQPVASVLKPESEKLRIGMQPEEVEAVCGKPPFNVTDPLGGAAMWQYKDDRAGDRLTVMFNMDGVAKIKYVKS